MDEHDVEAIEPLEIDGVFVDLADAVVVPPRWVIQDLLPPGLVFLAGPPKDAKKSTLTLIMALLTSGHDCRALPPFLRNVHMPGPVAMFSYEALAGELKDSALNGMGVNIQGGGIYVADDPWMFRLDDSERGPTALLSWLDKLLPRLVVLDPLRDFHGLDENDAGAMNRALRPVRQWAIKHDASVVVVHHTRKKSDDGSGGPPVYDAADMRGTTALFGIADACLMVTPTKFENTLRVKATFKRASGWERTLRLAIFGTKDELAREELTDGEKLCLKGLQDGQNLGSIAVKLKVSKSTIQAYVVTLYRNGLIKKEGERWVAA